MSPSGDIKNTHKLGLLAPRGVDPPHQIFRVCRGGCTLHISSKHYMGPTPVYGAIAEKPLQNADFAMKQTNMCRLGGDITRMVQLPATTAIEYVAACCITRTRMITKTKTKTKIETRTKIGTITKIVPGCLCPFPPSSMLIRTV